MYCNKCGKQIPEDSTFCEFCGGELNTVKPKKKMPITTIIIAALSAVIVFGGVGVFLATRGTDALTNGGAVSGNNATSNNVAPSGSNTAPNNSAAANNNTTTNDSTTVNNATDNDDSAAIVAYEIATELLTSSIGGMFVVEKGGKYGFMSRDGSMIASNMYTSVSEIDGGFAVVSQRGRKGLVDIYGNVILPCVYEDIGRNISNGAVLVKQGGKWGLVDTNGNEAAQFIYDDGNTFGFSEGVTPVKKGDKWGFIDSTGREVAPFIYTGLGADNAWYGFVEGFAVVNMGAGGWPEYGYIDTNLNAITPFIYSQARTFTAEGYARVQTSRGWGFIDKKGVEVASPSYHDARPFYYWLAPVANNNTISVPEYYNDKHWVHNGAFTYKTMERIEWGFIDTSGQTIISSNYANATFFTDGYAAVRSHDTLIYNSNITSGNRTIGFVTQGNGSWSIINTSGQQVADLSRYNSVENLFPSDGYFVVNEDWNRGVVDTTGAEVLPCAYDSIGFSKYEYTLVEIDGKFGIMNSSGDVAWVEL